MHNARFDSDGNVIDLSDCGPLRFVAFCLRTHATKWPTHVALTTPFLRTVGIYEPEVHVSDSRPGTACACIVCTSACPIHHSRSHPSDALHKYYFGCGHRPDIIEIISDYCRCWCGGLCGLSSQNGCDLLTLAITQSKTRRNIYWEKILPCFTPDGTRNSHTIE